MKNILLMLISFAGLFPHTNQAQTKNALTQHILKRIASEKAEVGVAISSEDGRTTVFINGDKHFPMQSVFKLPLAFYVLSEIDKGNFSLEDKIKISQEELLPNTWSPIREKYPEGTEMSLRNLLKYTVAQSDNNGADILLKMIGGPAKVEEYIHATGIQEMAIKHNEEEMHQDWQTQFNNWTSPKAANALLRKFYINDQHFLGKTAYRFIWKILQETQTGTEKIKGDLPRGTVVAHKTGHSGANEKGITAADNDIGVVTLPHGAHFFISVFITNSSEDAETHQELTADIAKLAWDYFTGKRRRNY